MKQGRREEGGRPYSVCHGVSPSPGTLGTLARRPAALGPRDSLGKGGSCPRRVRVSGAEGRVSDLRAGFQLGTRVRACRTYHVASPGHAGAGPRPLAMAIQRNPGKRKGASTGRSRVGRVRLFARTSYCGAALQRRWNEGQRCEYRLRDCVMLGVAGPDWFEAGARPPGAADLGELRACRPLAANRTRCCASSATLLVGTHVYTVRGTLPSK